MTINEVLSKLSGVTRRGHNSYLALCPAHADTKPSLCITEKNGKVLLYCFSGCTYQAIVASLGVTSRELSHKPKPDHHIEDIIARWQDLAIRPYVNPEWRDIVLEIIDLYLKFNECADRLEKLKP